MLQDIRQNAQGTASKIIIWLIVISFAAFGIESILLGGGGGAVAEVNGEEITAQELQQASAAQARRIIAEMGENYDPALMDEDRLRARALDSVIARKILTQSAAQMDLAISEGEIGSVVAQMEQFQVDGKFDAERYKLLLAENGYTPSSFKQSLTADLMLAQIRSGIAGSEFITASEMGLNAAVVGEQRDFRYLTIPGVSFAASVNVTEAEIASYHSENESEFLTPETVDVDYIQLTLDDYRQPVTEEDIQQAYEVLLQDFQSVTESHVSHILFTGESDTPVADLVAQAQSRLAAGESFAEVAQALSEDVGSASRGGDLGITSGDAFPPEMEAVISALEPGQISDPVETDAGTHIILLAERQESEAPRLEQVRPQLEVSLQDDAARARLMDDARALEDLSFNADDLAGPASELDLEVVTVQGVRRDAGEAPFDHAALRDAAFNEEVLGAGHNSELIELAGDQFVVLRVKRYNEPRIQPLEEVRDEIVSRIEQRRQREAVAGAAESILADLRGGEAIDQIAQERGYEWQVELAATRSAFSVAAPVLSRAFQLPAPDAGSVSDFVIMDNGDAVVIELTRVEAGSYDNLNPFEQRRLQQLLSNETGSLVDVEYQQAARQAADIVVM